MALTTAIAEAYAAATHDGRILHTIELDHPDFEAPAYLIDGVETDMDLPLETHVTVTFKRCAMSITPPGVTDSGPQPAKLKIDNVSGLVAPLLDDAVLSGASITVTYRVYSTKDLSGPGDVTPGLILRKVSLTPTSAEGELRWEETDLSAFPRMTYNQTLFPAVHDGWF